MTDLNQTTPPGSEVARALHRVVRAMHDGHCPNPECGHLGPSHEFYREAQFAWDHSTQNRRMTRPAGHECPACKLFISDEEAREALGVFTPFMRQNFEIFEAWREGRDGVEMVTPSVRVVESDFVVIDSEEKLLAAFGHPTVCCPYPVLMKTPIIAEFSQVASIDQGEA